MSGPACGRSEVFLEKSSRTRDDIDIGRELHDVVLAGIDVQLGAAARFFQSRSQRPALTWLHARVVAPVQDERGRRVADGDRRGCVETPGEDDCGTNLRILREERCREVAAKRIAEHANRSPGVLLFAPHDRVGDGLPPRDEMPLDVGIVGARGAGALEVMHEMHAESLRSNGSRNLLHKTPARRQSARAMQHDDRRRILRLAGAVGLDGDLLPAGRKAIHARASRAGGERRERQGKGERGGEA